MIEIDEVALAVGETAVLAGVDLSVGQGELLGLIGPNGAGKTTLLRAVNGLLEPDAGEVRVDGDAVATLDAKAVGRRVATVPQETHLAFAFTVEQVVEMGRTPHRSRLDWADATAAVDRALQRTETADLAGRTVDDLSGGERQRVLIARALAQETPVILLDEPTANLDMNHQVGVLDLVRELVDDGRTAMAAIHDLELAARYCDRLALLADGKIVAAGPPERVLTAARLEDAFGTAAVVGENELTGAPRVTAVDDDPDRAGHVHVVGGGREAARAVGHCWRAGFEVSVGPVPTGDVVATLAADLDQPAVTGPRFKPLDDAMGDALAGHLQRADAVVLATADPEPTTEAILADTGPIVEWSTESDGQTTDGPAGTGLATAVVDAIGGSTPADEPPSDEGMAAGDETDREAGSASGDD